MAKLCINCKKYPVFGGGYCKYCQYLRTDIKKTIKASNKPIKNSSKKRKEQLDTYNQLKKEALYMARKQPKSRCFFCDKEFEIDYMPDWHHLIGKENEKLTDVENLVFVHRDCHTLYHALPVDKITQYDWYIGFLNRLKEKSEQGYIIEINRHIRAGLLTIEEYLKLI